MMSSESWWGFRDAAEQPDRDDDDGEVAPYDGPDEWTCLKCGEMAPGCDCDLRAAIDAANEAAQEKAE